MSRSTLYSTSPNTVLHEQEEFGNSWLFSPIVWEILCQKYVPHEQYVFSEEHKIVKRFWNTEHFYELFNIVNPEMNRGLVQSEQIVWELANQQFFFTKDKDRVADGIEQFIFDNAEFTRTFEEKNSYSLGPHVYKRFVELARAIRALDPAKHKFFVHKNTSVDDSVECYFRKYNSEIDEYEYINLEDVEARIEFVHFNEKNVISFKYWDEIKDA